MMYEKFQNSDEKSLVEETEVLSVHNAKFDDKEHTKFTVIVETRTFGEIPFTYDCSGSDDTASQVSKEVGILYRNGDISIEEYSSEEDTTLQAELIRQMRDQLLSECDYFILPDYPASDEDKEEVKSYRQALRDITKQEGFPQEVVYPEKPSCLK